MECNKQWFTQPGKWKNSIIIIGTHDDGSPSILFSALGNVWVEKPPVYYDDEGMLGCLTNIPNGITYDFDRDLFYLACDNGVLFCLSNCAKCNKYLKISEHNLNAVTCADHFLMITGVDYALFFREL